MFLSQKKNLFSSIILSVFSFINSFALCCLLNSLLPLSPLQVFFCHCCFLVRQLAIGSSACISSFGTASPYLQLTINLSWLFNEEISLGISVKAARKKMKASPCEMQALGTSVICQSLGEKYCSVVLHNVKDKLSCVSSRCFSCPS